jgi:hypothetical protein
MPETSLSVPFMQNWLPGVQLLRTYDLKNISADLRAGLSVAAVAIPIGIAYAGLAGAPGNQSQHRETEGFVSNDVGPDWRGRQGRSRSVVPFCKSSG